jgi:hypothetical protein
MSMMLMFWNQILMMKNKRLFLITIEKNELKLLSDLNTLDYIEFDTLYSLSSLRENFKCAEFHGCLDVHITLLVNNCKGEYMVHHVYICSNLKSSFDMQKYDQLRVAIAIILSC